MTRAAGLAAICALLSVLRLVGVGHAGDANQAGMAAYQRGDFETAERLFQRAIGESPREPLFHYHRGAALTRLGRYVEAAQEYETALRLGPDAALADAARAGLAAVKPLTRPSATRRHVVRDEVSIPLFRSGGAWLADVTVNDERRARFLIDTGASISVVSPELARTLRIERDPGLAPIRLHTLAGVITAPIATIPSLSVGGLEASAVKAVIYDIGPGVDGILGNSFLDRYQVTVDAAGGRLLLRPR
jgi:clan AA aspartic protease (TIGR02281 family)